MKKLAIAAAIALIGAPAYSDGVPSGIYKTEPGDTGGYLHVKMGSCADAAKACGTILKAVDKDGNTVSDYEHKGKRIVWDMNEDGGGKFSGGRIWAPDKDKVYKSKMVDNGNTLKVSGCVGPICRSQNWVKIK